MQNPSVFFSPSFLWNNLYYLSGMENSQVNKIFSHSLPFIVWNYTTVLNITFQTQSSPFSCLQWELLQSAWNTWTHFLNRCCVVHHDHPHQSHPCPLVTAKQHLGCTRNYTKHFVTTLSFVLYYTLSVGIISVMPILMKGSCSLKW